MASRLEGRILKVGLRAVLKPTTPKNLFLGRSRFG